MVTDPPYGVRYDPAWRNAAGLSATTRTGTVMNDDLLRFKSLLETGKTRAHGEEAYHRVPPG